MRERSRETEMYLVRGKGNYGEGVGIRETERDIGSGTKGRREVYGEGRVI